MGGPINTNNNQKPNTNTNNSNNNKPLSNFEKMRKMMEKRGAGFGGPRPSAQMGIKDLESLQKFQKKMNIDSNNNNQGLGVIHEESDKMVKGYNPADDLEKKLDKIVVVKKDKKKMKKPTFEG